MVVQLYHYLNVMDAVLFNDVEGVFTGYWTGIVWGVYIIKANLDGSGRIIFWVSILFPCGGRLLCSPAMSPYDFSPSGGMFMKKCAFTFQGLTLGCH